MGTIERVREIRSASETFRGITYQSIVVATITTLITSLALFTGGAVRCVTKVALSLTLTISIGIRHSEDQKYIRGCLPASLTVRTGRIRAGHAWIITGQLRYKYAVFQCIFDVELFFISKRFDCEAFSKGIVW